ncbi:glycosyltransferase family 1 protein [Thozetella sp. PMI_491]|nr:glycosyltransferase family 1 protein [Thozetella sp. PMI_491]
MPPRKILLITNSDLGEANVFLATCHALLQADPLVELHLATSKLIENQVEAAYQLAKRSSPEARPIIFHGVKGVPLSDAFLQHAPNPEGGDYLPASFHLRPGLLNTARFLCDMRIVPMPWNGQQLTEIYKSIVDIVNSVKPDLTVANSLNAPSMTVCRHLGLRYAILSPNTIKDFAQASQPWGAMFWKYPSLGSAFPYPVPWYLIPLNIYYTILAIVLYLSDGRRVQAERHLEKETGAKALMISDLVLNPPSGVKLLVSIKEEVDFPLRNIPKHIIPCGMITRPALPVSESDAELERWLTRGPTVYVNLGSHTKATEDEAVEMALAFQVLLDRAASKPSLSDLQILWKLKKKQEYGVSAPGCRIHEVLSKELDQDRVRIVGWVTAEPVAVLQTGQVICSVNHGGANSFAEAVCAGVPRVILPQWADCYDFAHRAEWLGIGRWGSRTMKPKWSAKELSRELVEVVLGGKAPDMKQRAEKLAKICNQDGGGAAVAAKHLLAELYA